MSLRPSRSAAGAGEDCDGSALSVDLVIAAARTANSAFLNRFHRDVRIETGTVADRGQEDKSALKEFEYSKPLKWKGRHSNRIPLSREVDPATNTETLKNVFLLDALTRLDAAHDPLCEGASISSNVVATKPPTVGPWGVTDCNVDGYFMTKFTPLGTGGQLPTVISSEPLSKILDAPYIDIENVPYKGPYPKACINMDDPNNMFVETAPPRDGRTVFGETLRFRALAPYMKPEETIGRTRRGGTEATRKVPTAGLEPLEALKEMCNEAGYVPQGPYYHDKIQVVGKKAMQDVPAGMRPTQLEDFIDNLCIDIRLEGLREGEGVQGEDAEWPQRLGAAAMHRKENLTPDPQNHYRVTVLKRGQLDNKHPNYKKDSTEDARYTQGSSINSDSFKKELAEWTTWAVLDTVGCFPRGAVFVLHVPLKTAYERWPRLPIFKPSYVTDDEWGLYTRILRRARIYRDYSKSPKTKAPILFWEKFVADVAMHGLNHVCPFTEQGELKSDPAFAHYRATDKRAGSEDYLYTTLVCASTREPDFAAGTSAETGFGSVLLEGVQRLASKLGMVRLVLSALPPVVGYYNNVHSYDPCSRTGLNLTYLTWEFGIHREKRADNSGATLRTPEAYGSRLVDIYYSREVPIDYFRVPTDNSRLIALQKTYGVPDEKKYRVDDEPTLYVCYPASPMILNEDASGNVQANENVRNLAVSTMTSRDTPAPEEGNALYTTLLTRVNENALLKRIADIELSFEERKPQLQGSKKQRNEAPDRNDPGCDEYLEADDRALCVLREFQLDDAKDSLVNNPTNPPVPYVDALAYTVKRFEFRQLVGFKFLNPKP